MSVTATAPIAILLYRLRWQIGNAPAWVQWTGQQPSVAIESVFIYSPHEAAINTSPIAVVEMGETYAINRIGLDQWRHSGSFTVSIEATVPTAYTDSPIDAYLDFTNKIGALDKNLRDMPRGPYWFNVLAVNYLIPPVRTVPEDRDNGIGDWFTSVIQLTVEQGDP